LTIVPRYKDWLERSKVSEREDEEALESDGEEGDQKQHSGSHGNQDQKRWQQRQRGSSKMEVHGSKGNKGMICSHPAYMLCLIEKYHQIRDFKIM
jgi:hypothetical protein